MDPLNKRPGEPLNLSLHYEEEEIPLPLSGFEPRTVVLVLYRPKIIKPKPTERHSVDFI